MSVPMSFDLNADFANFGHPLIAASVTHANRISSL